MKSNTIGFGAFALFLLSFFPLYTDAQERTWGTLPDPEELLSGLPKASAPREGDKLKLPKSVNLSSKLPEVRDQEGLRASASFASAYLLRTYLDGNPKEPFSPLFNYNLLNHGKNQGVSLLESLFSLVSHGVVYEKDYPFSPLYREKPTKDLMEIARNYRLHKIREVDTTDLWSVKYLLSEGKLVLATILVPENLLNWNGGEVFQNFSPKILGTQAIAIIGYDDSNSSFLVQNSWGKSWGNKGYALIHYNTFRKLARTAFIAEKSDESVVIRPPVGLSATEGNYPDQILVQWESVPGALGYEIHRKRPDESRYQRIGLSVLTRFEDTGVLPDLAYSYKIRSVMEDGESELSKETVVGFAKSKPTNLGLPKVSGLKATVGQFSNRVILTWNPVKGADSYQILKWNRYSGKVQLLSRASTTQYIDTRAQKNGQKELYQVRAVQKGKEGEISEFVVGATAGQDESISMRSANALELELETIMEKGQTVNWKIKNSSLLPSDARIWIWRRTPQTSWVMISTIDADRDSFQDILPTKDELYFYALSLGESSPKSKIQSVTISQPIKDTKKVRAFAQESFLQKFKGPWTAMVWDGGSQVRQVRLLIDSDEMNSEYQIKLNEDTIVGRYVTESPVLEEKGKIRIEMVPSEDALSVQIRDLGVFKKETKLSFLRE